jgi:hypothetical protein
VGILRAIECKQSQLPEVNRIDPAGKERLQSVIRRKKEEGLLRRAMQLSLPE